MIVRVLPGKVHYKKKSKQTIRKLSKMDHILESADDQINLEKFLQRSNWTLSNQSKHQPY